MGPGEERPAAGGLPPADPHSTRPGARPGAGAVAPDRDGAAVASSVPAPAPGSMPPRPPPHPAPRPSSRPARRLLAVPRFAQPDDVTCGPTCLLQVFRYFGDLTPFDEILEVVRRNEDGGTLAVHLGAAALMHGYAARIASWNLRIFDPTWRGLETGALRAKLRARASWTREPKLREALTAYDEFLCAGGEVRFGLDLSPALLMRSIDRGHPVLTGLSATHLYQQVRERPRDNADDDVHGEPVGHFVVVAGYEREGRRFVVRDPHHSVPFSRTGRYSMPAERLINAILLGDSTYDAVLLELWPRGRRRRT